MLETASLIYFQQRVRHFYRCFNTQGRGGERSELYDQKLAVFIPSSLPSCADPAGVLGFEDMPQQHKGRVSPFPEGIGTGRTENAPV